MTIFHKEVIQAYLNGKKIEFLFDGIWFPLNHYGWGYNPITNIELQWRVVTDSPLKIAAKLYEKKSKNLMSHLEACAFRQGWDSMAHYLIENGLIEKEDIPKNTKE